MAEVGQAVLNQTTEIILQPIVISTLLLAFSFFLLVQLVTSQTLSEALVLARRTIFWALVMFVAATGSSLILLIRIHGYLVIASLVEPTRVVVPVYGLGSFNLLFGLLLPTVSLDLVLWVSGLCQLALTDERRVALPIIAVCISILFILTIGLLMPDTESHCSSSRLRSRGFARTSFASSP